MLYDAHTANGFYRTVEEDELEAFCDATSHDVYEETERDGWSGVLVDVEPVVLVRLGVPVREEARLWLAAMAVA